jgi:hypothetical protein
LRPISTSNTALLTHVARPRRISRRIRSTASASVRTRLWLWSSVRRFRQQASRHRSVPLRSVATEGLNGQPRHPVHFLIGRWACGPESVSELSRCPWRASGIRGP